ncbi:unnamed protein product [Cuscuta europaea]|uniref:Uncharacterized protein n=1 Tax=Cuscuta europaea TaxID=41803 RepID=A0A9P0YU22_CUSEU|nr:unnamed protein product [Cuscuta europaea]
MGHSYLKYEKQTHAPYTFSPKRQKHKTTEIHNRSMCSKSMTTEAPKHKETIQMTLTQITNTHVDNIAKNTNETLFIVFTRYGPRSRNPTRLLQQQMMFPFPAEVSTFT